MALITKKEIGIIFIAIATGLISIEIQNFFPNKQFISIAIFLIGGLFLLKNN